MLMESIVRRTLAIKDHRVPRITRNASGNRIEYDHNARRRLPGSHCGVEDGGDFERRGAVTAADVINELAVELLVASRSRLSSEELFSRQAARMCRVSARAWAERGVLRPSLSAPPPESQTLDEDIWHSTQCHMAQQ